MGQSEPGCGETGFLHQHSHDKIPYAHQRGHGGHKCHEDHSHGQHKHKNGYGHHHHSISFREIAADKRQKMQRCLLFTIAINLGITLSELIVGIWANSMALLSDALHNFSDVLALVLSLIGLYLLKRKAQNTQTFGYQRVELVIGLINAISLIFIGLFALGPALKFFYTHVYNYFYNIEDSHNILGLPIFIASLVSIVLNGLSVYILERGEHDSISMRSSILHLFSDMLTSIAVCFAGIMIYFFEFYWVDPVISIIIAMYIISSSYKLARYSIQVLLNFNVTGIHVREIAKSLYQIEEVHSVSHIHLWSLSESITMLEAHVGVRTELRLRELDELNQKLKKILSETFQIHHITFEFHPTACRKQECRFIEQMEPADGLSG